MIDPEFEAMVDAQKKIVERSNNTREKIVTVMTESPDDIKSISEQHRLIGGKVILEIGHGGNFCVDVPDKSVVVGVEPMTNPRVFSNEVEKGKLGERLFFNSDVESLPNFLHPEAVIIVAPSPEDYQPIFEAVLEKVDSHTKFVLFVENQSRQASEGVSAQMVAYYSRIMKKRGLRVDVDSSVMDLGDDFNSFLGDVGLSGSLSTFWNESDAWKVITGQ